jgi:hypothetical protein
MANNYLQFSFAIPRITTIEAQWVRDYLTEAQTLSYEGNVDTVLTPAQKRDRFYVAVKKCGSLNFQWALDEDGLWIYAEESGDPNMVAGFVQRFLKTHRPKCFVTFTYAEWCSRMRLDEFGGGAMAITAFWVSSINAHGWEAMRDVAMKKRGLKRA